MADETSAATTHSDRACVGPGRIGLPSWLDARSPQGGGRGTADATRRASAPGFGAEMVPGFELCGREIFLSDGDRRVSVAVAETYERARALFETLLVVQRARAAICGGDR